MDYLKKIKNIKKQIDMLSKEFTNLSKQIPYSGTKKAKKSDEHIEDSISRIQSYLALSPQIEEDELLKMILQCAMHSVNAGGAGLTLLKKPGSRRGKRKLVFKAALGDGAEGIIGYEVPVEGSRHGEALQTGEVVSSTPLHTAIEDKTKATFRNVLVAPLIVHGEPVGTMSAVNKQNGDHFTPQDMEAYRLFSDLAAMVVRQRLRENVLERLIKGDRKTVPDELQDLRFTANDAELLGIVQDIVRLSRRREDLMPLFKQLTVLLLEISSRLDWTR